MQSDGKFLVGGNFTTIAGQARSGLARFEADGSIDAGFTTGVSNSVNVRAIAVQPDGRILVGGGFLTIGGVPRSALARLDSSGNVEAGFDAEVTGGAVQCLSLTVDGKILLGGTFNEVSGTLGNGVARLHANGSLDTDFSPNANQFVWDLVSQADGKILIAYQGTSIGGQTRNRLARLNGDTAFQRLTVTETQILWERGGASPEIEEARFEQSIDDGATWTPLGYGTRVGTTGDWTLAADAVARQGNVLVRAIGRKVSNSAERGGTSVYESVRQAYLLPCPAVTDLSALKRQIAKVKKAIRKAKASGKTARVKSLKKKLRRLTVQLRQAG